MSKILVVVLALLLPLGVKAAGIVPDGIELIYFWSADSRLVEETCDDFAWDKTILRINLDWTDPDGDGIYRIEDSTLVCDCLVMASDTEWECYLVYDGKFPNSRGSLGKGAYKFTESKKPPKWWSYDTYGR